MGEQEKRRTFVFAGGGSGGHIYPGLAIAEELVREADARGVARPEILFVVSDRPLDEKIMLGSGHRFLRSPARPLYKSLKGILGFASGWRRARRQGASELRSLGIASSVHVVALGGFVAGPFVASARSVGVPITMVNLDAVPGKANRLIAKRADRIFTAARVPPEHRRARAWVEIPPIVRASAQVSANREESRRTLGLDPARPVLMVTGGSQGLRSVNDFVLAFAASDAGRRTLGNNRWQVLHQTGRNFDEAARAAYAKAGIDAMVVPFTDQMGLWWGAADLAVCTAGAGNIAEIWSSKAPALLLPYPHHNDEHQKFNAAPLSACGGAVVVKDWIDPAVNLEHNGNTLETLLGTPDRRATMRRALETLGPADGASRIARALLDTPAGGS